MEAKAVDVKRQKPKARSGDQKQKRKASKTRGKHGANRKGHRGSKSRSKGKNKGFLCCRKKQKHSKKRKSRTTKKQPRTKLVKPLPPVPNEQLGEIVLVKNIDKAKTPVKAVDKKEPQSPDRDALKPPKAESVVKENVSKEKAETDNEEKEKGKPNNSKEVVENEKEDKEKAKAEQKEKKKETKEVKEVKETKEGKDGKEEGEETKEKQEEKKDKWLKLAKRFIEEDANIAANDFEQVAGYVPPHVSKRHFVLNMEQNRFADVVCLDHSRVSLNDSTYIHASWVDLSSQKKAILTQLPLPHTAADFWQMIIEQRVKCVLLTLTEQECDKLGGNFVFPQNQDFLNFEERSIRVGEFKQVEISRGWNMRVLSITNGDYKSFLHVHHYKLWAHNSTPPNVKQLWQLQSCLRKYSNPPVYMSLSGCGRAGTFALFESAHISLHSDTPSFDMIKCLENVRNGRMHSVQNINQFSFVYTLIAEHILGNGFCKLAKGGAEDATDDSIETILRQLTIH
ncbi:unnamed protein product [Caenorhabditis sp. 36 PRJEB53466]|nr:unnamed protein product [Caenorhabditis sp. 36 PRJEB53466]